VQNVIREKEDGVQGLFAMLLLNEIVDVGNSGLRWKARVGTTPFMAICIQFARVFGDLRRVFVTARG